MKFYPPKNKTCVSKRWDELVIRFGGTKTVCTGSWLKCEFSTLTLLPCTRRRFLAFGFFVRYEVQCENWMPTNFGFVGWQTFWICNWNCWEEIEKQRGGEKSSLYKLIHGKIGNFVSLMVRYKLSIAHRTILINLNKMAQPDALHLLRLLCVCVYYVQCNWNACVCMRCMKCSIDAQKNQ